MEVISLFQTQYSVMNTDEKKMPPPTLSIIQRLNRLEHIVKLLFLEEKLCSSERHVGDRIDLDESVKPENELMSLSAALEEVHHKGTISDRITLLENRVFQLSLELAGGNMSRSSSSPVVPAVQNKGHGSGVTKLGERKSDQDSVINLHIKQDHPHLAQDKSFGEECNVISESCKIGKRQRKSVRPGRNRKWLGWLHRGC